MSTCHDVYDWPGQRDQLTVSVVHFAGIMDLASRRKLWEMICDPSARDTIIDLSDAVPDLASTGMLVAFLTQARQRCQRVVVVCPDPVQYKALLAGSLRQAVRIVSSQSEALRWLALPAPRSTAGAR